MAVLGDHRVVLFFRPVHAYTVPGVRPFGVVLCRVMTSVEDVRVFALDRDVDISGVSDTGRIAYGVRVGDGTVLLAWDTAHETTLDWRPDIATVEAIHGHHGSTRLTPLDEDPVGQARARSLVAPVIARVMRTHAAVADWLLGA